jgi:hypothetical protein
VTGWSPPDSDQVVYSCDAGFTRAAVSCGMCFRLAPVSQVLGAHGDEEECALCLGRQLDLQGTAISWLLELGT